MINFTSTPLGGKIIPQTPKKPDNDTYPQRPLGGLITNPNPKKTPLNPQPLGGLITPNPTRFPKNPKMPQPIGGLVSPKPPKRPEMPDVILFPSKEPSVDTPESNKKSTIGKILKFAAVACLITALYRKGPDLINKIFKK